MTYRLIRSRRIQIKHRHSPNYRTLCQPMVFITLTVAIIIQIQIKCKRLHRHRPLQRPVICQQMVTRSIIILARIDIGRDSRTQLTKGDNFLFSFSFEISHSLFLGLLLPIFFTPFSVALMESRIYAIFDHSWPFACRTFLAYEPKT